MWLSLFSKGGKGGIDRTWTQGYLDLLHGVASGAELAQEVS